MQVTKSDDALSSLTYFVGNIIRILGEVLLFIAKSVSANYIR
jgi:hypothetical protein